MKLLAKIILLSVVFQPMQTFASERQCFQGRYRFFENFEGINASPDEKTKIMEKACKELGNAELMEAKSLLARLSIPISSGVYGMLGQGLGAFSKLGDSEKQRKYMESLEQIKKIPDAMVRIQLTYNLVVSNQGRYDYEGMGFDAMISGWFIRWFEPGSLLSNVEATGSAGVCSSFANLLQWSLLQVSRYSGSSSMALAPTDFSSETYTGWVPGPNGWADGWGHAWVRVNLPRFSEKGQLLGFSHFDLDTTWYPQFSPLFPRRSGLSEEKRKEALRQCQEIQMCLKQL